MFIVNILILCSGLSLIILVIVSTSHRRKMTSVAMHRFFIVFVLLLVISYSNGFLKYQGVCKIETKLNAIRDLYPHYFRKRLAPPERLPEKVRLKGDVKRIGKKGDIVSVTVQQWRTIIKKKHIGVRLTPEEMEELAVKKSAKLKLQRDLAVDAIRNISSLPRLTLYGTVNKVNTFVFPFLNRHLIDEIHDKIGVHNIQRMVLPHGIVSLATIQVVDGEEVVTPQEFDSRKGLSINKPGLYQVGVRLQRDVDTANVTVHLVPVNSTSTSDFSVE